MKQLFLAATSLMLLTAGCSHAPVGQSQDQVAVDRSSPDHTVVTLKGDWTCGPVTNTQNGTVTCTQGTPETRKPGSVSSDDQYQSDRYFQSHAINSRY